jgi:flagellar biosynthetic protein FliP
MTRRMQAVLAALMLLLAFAPSASAAGLPVLSVHAAPDGGQTWTLSVQILLLMTALTLLPAILLMMTSFTRIIIVLSLLRQALGTGQTPPNQVLLGLALFLTFFIMGPVLSQSWNQGVQPYLDGKMQAGPAYTAAAAPFRGFMLAQTRDADLQLFAKLSGSRGYADAKAVPMSVLVPAFATSELKTAFEMGFLLFIPFLVIDIVVSSVLMSMGMMMVSPMLISLPFKIMLFVLVDGWTLVIGTLARSFVH